MKTFVNAGKQSSCADAFELATVVGLFGALIGFSFSQFSPLWGNFLVMVAEPFSSVRLDVALGHMLLFVALAFVGLFLGMLMSAGISQNISIKKCSHCAKLIKLEATTCKHCGQGQDFFVYEKNEIRSSILECIEKKSQEAESAAGSLIEVIFKSEVLPFVKFEN
jgi:hypothetical protein